MSARQAWGKTIIIQYMKGNHLYCTLLEEDTVNKSGLTEEGQQSSLRKEGPRTRSWKRLVNNILKRDREWGVYTYRRGALSWICEHF